MSIFLQLITILLTSLLTSVLTLMLARRQFEKQYKDVLDEKLRQVFDELGDIVEERVRKGVLDAVASIPSTEVLQSATRTVTRTGVDLVEGGLSALLGGSRTRRRDKKNE